jgi:hypothetical protein
VTLNWGQNRQWQDVIGTVVDCDADGYRIKIENVGTNSYYKVGDVVGRWSREHFSIALRCACCEGEANFDDYLCETCRERQP